MTLALACILVFSSVVVLTKATAIASRKWSEFTTPQLFGDEEDRPTEPPEELPTQPCNPVPTPLPPAAEVTYLHPDFHRIVRERGLLAGWGKA